MKFMTKTASKAAGELEKKAVEAADLLHLFPGIGPMIRGFQVGMKTYRPVRGALYGGLGSIFTPLGSYLAVESLRPKNIIDHIRYGTPKGGAALLGLAGLGGLGLHRALSRDEDNQ